MPTVTMPQLGEGVEEGTIGKWLKKEGDHVAAGEPIVEVITDKVNAEVPSPFEGTLARILVAEGDTVQNDAAIAVVEAAGAVAVTVPMETVPHTTGAAAAPDVGTAAQPGAAQPDAAPAATQPDAPAAVASTGPSGMPGGDGADSAPIGDGAGSRPAAAVAATAVAVTALPPVASGTVGETTVFKGRMTPAVRRLVREHGVDLAAIPGTGLGGRITRGDVEGAIAAGAVGVAPRSAAPAGSPASTAAQATPMPRPAGAAPPPAATLESDSLKKLTPMRRAIAAQMTRSLEVPTAYITIEVDMSPVVRRRDGVKQEYQSREGVSLSYVAFVTKACVEALRRHPDLNAHWTEEGHWRRKAINVGIAVAVEDGLMVPVIRDADTLSLHGLNRAINDLATRARSKKIKPEELQGGTFTVDNTGWTGSILTLPIINVPEVAIVTMEKIVKRPVVLEGPDGDAIAVRSMMNMCIAIDHRATDGAQAGAFLADIRTWLEAVDEQTPIW